MTPRRPFISSTFVDLERHRRAVLDGLQRMGLSPFGMEYMGSRPQEPTEAAFEEIRRSDSFVGIYARRYGTVPDGHSLSVTEQEFDYARARGLPCFIYVLDRSFPWPPEHIETAATAQLDALIAKVEKLVRS